MTPTLTLLNCFRIDFPGVVGDCLWDLLFSPLLLGVPRFVITLMLWRLHLQLQQNILHPLKNVFWNLFNLHYIKHYI